MERNKQKFMRWMYTAQVGRMDLSFWSPAPAPGATTRR